MVYSNVVEYRFLENNERKYLTNWILFVILENSESLKN